MAIWVAWVRIDEYVLSIFDPVPVAFILNLYDVFDVRPVSVVLVVEPFNTVALFEKSGTGSSQSRIESHTHLHQYTAFQDKVILVAVCAVEDRLVGEGSAVYCDI